MAQNGFVAIVMCVSFLTIVYSKSTDDNNLLLFKYKCTQDNYYDLEYGGCLSCKKCERENMKTKTPCGLHNNTVCGDCFDGYEKQLQGTTITCQSSDKNDNSAHPGGDGDLDIGSSSSTRPSYNTIVTPTSPERTKDVSTSDDVKAPILSNEIIFIVKIGLGLIGLAIILIAAIVYARRLITHLVGQRKGRLSKAQAHDEPIRETNQLTRPTIVIPAKKWKCHKLYLIEVEGRPRRISYFRTRASGRHWTHPDSSTSTEPDQNLSLITSGTNSDDYNIDMNSSNLNPPITPVQARDQSASLLMYSIPTASSPTPSVHAPSDRREGNVNEPTSKQTLEQDDPLNQSA